MLKITFEEFKNSIIIYVFVSIYLTNVKSIYRTYLKVGKCKMQSYDNTYKKCSHDMTLTNDVKAGL